MSVSTSPVTAASRHISKVQQVRNLNAELAELMRKWYANDIDSNVFACEVGAINTRISMVIGR